MPRGEKERERERERRANQRRDQRTGIYRATVRLASYSFQPRVPRRNEKQLRLIESVVAEVARGKKSLRAFEARPTNCRVVPLSRQQIIEIEVLARHTSTEERNTEGRESFQETVDSCRAIDRTPSPASFHQAKSPGLGDAAVASAKNTAVARERGGRVVAE